MKVLFLTTAVILGLSVVRLPEAISGPIDSTPGVSAPGAELGPVDTYFVTQTSLGPRFRPMPVSLPKPTGTTQAIRSAH